MSSYYDDDDDDDNGSKEASNQLDPYQPSMEELQDEKEDKAVRPIQALVRQWLGRRYAREYGKQVFIKEFDEDLKKWAYVDTRRSPPERQWAKPKWLGQDDLPEERVYVRPPGYPKRRQTQRQFALVSHTPVFDDDKVPNLASVKGVRIEHDEMKEKMQNPYTANFSAKDTSFLWEPSKNLFLKSLEGLRGKCVGHIEQEAKGLKLRLEQNFLHTLDEMYDGRVDDGDNSKAGSGGGKKAHTTPLPSWETASNFASELLDHKHWRAFDKYRVAVESSRACALKAQELAPKDQSYEQEDQPEAGSASSSSAGGEGGGGGGGGKQRGSAAATSRQSVRQSRSGSIKERPKDADPEEPTQSDLLEAQAERRRLFSGWHELRSSERASTAKIEEETRRARKLLRLKAANPGRIIEDWEADAADDDDDKQTNKNDEVRVEEKGESAETQRIRALTLEAMKRINRNRLALAAAQSNSQTSSSGGASDVFKALGTDFKQLRDKNPAADRLLTLIDPHGLVAQQRKAALLVQARYRGWKGREAYGDAQQEWGSNAHLREAAKALALTAARRQEEAERLKKRQQLGRNPFDQPVAYPWDDRYPTTSHRSLEFRDAAVTIYIKAHVGRLKSGKHKGAYLLFRDSSWRSTPAVLRSCLSLDLLAQHVRAIPIRQRLIVLDVVHQEYPKDDSYFKSRVLYPPANLYADLAAKAQAVVLGSCLIGSSLRSDHFTSHPPRSATHLLMAEAALSLPLLSSSAHAAGGAAAGGGSGGKAVKVHPVGSSTNSSSSSSGGARELEARQRKGGSLVEGEDVSAHALRQHVCSVLANKQRPVSEEAGADLSAKKKKKKNKRRRKRKSAPQDGGGGGSSGGVAGEDNDDGDDDDDKEEEERLKALEAALFEARRGKKKPEAKLRKLPWRLENAKKDTRLRHCENALFHPRQPPAKYATYASLEARTQRDAVAKRKRAKVEEEAARVARAKKEAKDAADRAGRRKRREEKRQANEESGEGFDDDDDEEDVNEDRGGAAGDNLEDEPWDRRISIFGEALLDAMSGEAANPDEADVMQTHGVDAAASSGIFGAGMVTLSQLFDFLSVRVTGHAGKVRNLECAKAKVEREEAYQKGLVEAEEQGGEVATHKFHASWVREEHKTKRESPLGVGRKPGQHLCLWSWHHLLSEQMCVFPCPTPPPSCTQVQPTSIKYRHIDVAWEVPDYDGEPVMYFEVQLREPFTKLTCQWEATCRFKDRDGNYAPVLKTRIRVPHLAPGVEVQFRVRGRNHGGWGPFSDESDFFMAGRDQQPTTVGYMLGRLVLFGPNQLLNFMGERANQPRLPVQQLGLLQLGSLARDMRNKGSPGAAMLRPTVARLAAEAALRAMRNFPWDKPVQQRACVLVARLFHKHGLWLIGHARKDEGKRLKRVAKNLKAQQEGEARERDMNQPAGGGAEGSGALVVVINAADTAAGGGGSSGNAVVVSAGDDGGDDGDGAEDDERSVASELTKNVAGMTKKERLQQQQALEDAGMLDVMFALAAIQLRFGRRDVAMLFAVDQVLKSM